ncbi:transposase [Micromonospora sp. LOL_023]|uniref:transposase n=1 Tax=Micromonospora sp. LOL_023 TaxID=3345418 RepID=UPI003A8870CF
MPAPRKYSDELRERATRLVVEARRSIASSVGAIWRIADQLGVCPEALRGWVKKAETDAGQRACTASGDADRVAALETGGP